MRQPEAATSLQNGRAITSRTKSGLEAGDSTRGSEEKKSFAAANGDCTVDSRCGSQKSISRTPPSTVQVGLVVVNLAFWPFFRPAPKISSIVANNSGHEGSSMCHSKPSPQASARHSRRIPSRMSKLAFHTYSTVSTLEHRPFQTGPLGLSPTHTRRYLKPTVRQPSTLPALEHQPFQIAPSGLSPKYPRRNFEVNCRGSTMSTVRHQPFQIEPLALIPKTSRRSPIPPKLTSLLHGPAGPCAHSISSDNRISASCPLKPG